MRGGARTPLTVDLGGYRVAISAGANGIGKVMADIKERNVSIGEAEIRAKLAELAVTAKEQILSEHK